jgi:homospermidine synthase
MKGLNKKNLLILGASGGVAHAFLSIFPKYRNFFDKVVLLDKDDKVINSLYIDHKNIDYFFVKENLNECNIKFIIENLKLKYSISIVLDLTDYNTIPILSVVDSLGMAYLNCSLNLEDPSMINFVEDSKRLFNQFRRNTHILSLGMNPGIIHHLIAKGIVEYGLPTEFIEIEYDSSIPTKETKKPFITWSKKQFLNEAVWSKTGLCVEGGKYLELEKNAINTLEDTKNLLSPIKKMLNYPRGMVVPHDEVITLARFLEIPGKFVYAIHPDSLSKLVKIANIKTTVKECDIEYLDNISQPLSGYDYIGVWLKYPNKMVCYYFSVDNSNVEGTNATLFLVGVGVVAGLIDFIQNPFLDNGVYSALELNNENFLKLVSNHVKVKKHVDNLK